MELIWQALPEVSLGSSTFRNVPIIIQYLDTPVLQLIESEHAAYTVKFPVYMSDGTQIATVKGSHIYRTDNGKKAKFEPHYYPDATVFELENKPVLELRRKGAAAIRGYAELYAPEGVLIEASDPKVTNLLSTAGHLQIGTHVIVDLFCDGTLIGVHVQNDRVSIGGGEGGIRKFRYIGPADQPLPEWANSSS